MKERRRERGNKGSRKHWKEEEGKEREGEEVRQVMRERERDKMGRRERGSKGSRVV